MKKRVGTSCAVLAALAVCTLSAATVDRTVVRQLWPWQDTIVVEFRLSGVTAPTDVNVTLSCNGVPVALPSTAFAGELFALEADGLYQAKITPPPGLLGKKVDNLGVAVTPVEPQTSTNVLYRIYDLDSGSCENVTAGSIVNSYRGSWYWANAGAQHLVPGEATPAALTNLVWTGVAEDDKYRTTHLVMRYLAAAGDNVYKLGYNVAGSTKVMPADFSTLPCSRQPRPNGRTSWGQHAPGSSPTRRRGSRPTMFPIT